MLDMQRLRDRLEETIERLNTRGDDFAYLKSLIDLDVKRRNIIVKVEEIKALRNQNAKQIGLLKREGKEVESILASMESSKTELTSLEDALRAIEEELKEALLRIPNVPHDAIPVGQDENDNRLVKTEGILPTFSFDPKPHWELGESLHLLDFERATKISASRFVVYQGLGARLERALIQFMMDHHAEAGYQEMLLPYLVNEASMVGTGQFPKFKEDAFATTDERGLYLNPTAEVPGINLHREEILAESELPRRYTAFTTAFRQEAGSAGRDTRGILRQHQFNKVELIQITTPETSYAALDAMLAQSESILKLLKIPYRVVELCSGDLGFAMAKTYDIEVYLPSYGTYREIGSISNAEDFQARRANIRFKRSKEAKPEYVHTLNGSGLAVGRTWIAIVENYQNEDGTITVPEVLRPYMKTDIIK